MLTLPTVSLNVVGDEAAAVCSLFVVVRGIQNNKKK